MAGAPPQQQLTGLDHVQRAQGLVELLQEYSAQAPLKGLQEGLDPALMDSVYQPLFSPDIENLRVVSGRWEARAGQTLYQSLPGAGLPRLLANLYQSTAVTAGGQITRLAARGTGAGGVLYELKAESDTAFVAVSGGTGLGGTSQPLFQGVTVGDRFILTDRSGALKQYQRAAASPGTLAAVSNGTAPGVAARVKARSFGRLEDWTGNSNTAPYGWTVASGAAFNFAALNSTDPGTPGGGLTVNVKVLTSAAVNKTLANNASHAVPSHTIAFWTNQHVNKALTAFEIGILQAGEYQVTLRNPSADDWYPVYLPIGDIGTLAYVQFRCISASTSNTSMWVSALTLPGQLEGWYRWVYTYYNPTTGIESAPSPLPTSASDFSAVGVTGDPTTSRAFQKSAALSFTAAGSPQKIRIYRNGGVPELTTDENGFDVWYRVGEIFDVSTLTTTATVNPGDRTMTLASTTNISVGDLLVLDKGVAGAEEYVTVATLPGAGVVTFGGTNVDTANPARVGGAVATHPVGTHVQLAYLDNTANEAIDVTQPVDLRRDDPPQGGRFVQLAPDGRLWIFGYKDNPTGVAVSNRPTADRPQDYLTFPDGVDPLTRRQVNQGWRFKVGGDNTDEEIVWGGFFEGRPLIITKRHTYLVTAQSQTEWGAFAVRKILNLGCLAGDSVAEVNNELYWVTDGPRVARWGGERSEPNIISHLKVNVRLQAAPSANWSQWVGRYHPTLNGECYALYLTPSGQSANTQRLDYNAEADAWEPVVYYDQNSAAIPMATALVWDGASDDRSLYQVDTTGRIWKTEQGTTDGGNPILIRGSTKRIPLAIYSRFPSGALGDVAPGATRHLLIGQVALLTQLFFRFNAVNDTLAVQVQVGGAEYGVTTHNYSFSLAGSGDREIKQRLHRDLLGRWAQITFSGAVSNGPAVREVVVWGLPTRSGAVAT